MKALICVIIFCVYLNFAAACNPSATTVSGTHAPGNVCSGQLVFEENFNTLDQSKWRHEVTMSGGGNYEFQWYVKNLIRKALKF